ncbi:putative ABM domain-containing protein [Seiridium cardinale]
MVGVSSSDSTVASPAWQKDGQRIVTNVISVKETKDAMDKTFELLQRFLQQVKEKEPGVELFLLNKDDERFQYVTYEIYKDEAAVQNHLHTAHMKELIEGEKTHQVKRGENDVHHETLVAQVGPR